MRNLQYDSFYKFLVSVGIVLIIAPLLGLHYIVSGSWDVFLTIEEFDALSSVSSELLEKRVDFISILYGIFPTLCALSIIIGGVVLGLGCEQWYGIQRKLDELMDIDVLVKRFNWEKMSSEEIIKKHEEEDRKDNSNEDNEKVAMNEEDRNLPTASSDSLKRKAFSRVYKAVRIETGCAKYLQKTLDRDYVIHQNIRIEGNEYDIIATSKKNNIDMLYEIKYWPDVVKDDTIERTLRKLLLNGISYESNLHRNWNFILFVVTSEKFISVYEEKLEKYKSYGISFEIFDENKFLGTIIPN